MDTLQALKEVGTPVQFWYVLVMALVGILLLLVSILIYLIKDFLAGMKDSIVKLTNMIYLHETEIQVLKSKIPNRK